MENFNKFIKHGNLKALPYQEEGVKWCLDRESPSEKIKGGIIADEMGLGKTITMLAVIALQMKTAKRTLIILPPSLLEQWYMQIHKILGHDPLIYHGEIKKTAKMIPNDTPITLSTYGCLGNETLQSTQWDRVIFDEAHYMRNPATKIHKNAIKLKTRSKFLLTGTPIQNKRRDLYSLFALLGLSRDTYVKEEERKPLIQKYILRRTKKSVGLASQLKPLTETTTYVPWEIQDQKKRSMFLHSQLPFAKVDQEVDLDEEGRDPYYYGPPIVLLLRAKQSCVYGTRFDDKSSKISLVAEKIIEQKENQNKKLVFCHFRREMDMLQEELECAGMIVGKIDGRISSKTERTQIFSDKEVDVLLIQIQVGAEGLNLQQYSEIYFVSPAWNPFLEEQAIGRCYRIGQEKEVFVHRFYMDSFDSDRETITQDLYSSSVQEKKRKLEKEIFTIVN